jgi:hypothetical protein
MAGDDVYLEVAEGIELKMTKSSIAGKVRTDSASSDTDIDTKSEATTADDTDSGATSITRGWRKGR